MAFIRKEELNTTPHRDYPRLAFFPAPFPLASTSTTGRPRPPEPPASASAPWSPDPLTSESSSRLRLLPLHAEASGHPRATASRRTPATLRVSTRSNRSFLCPHGYQAITMRVPSRTVTFEEPPASTI